MEDPVQRAHDLLQEAEKLLYRRVQGNRRATRELVLVREALEALRSALARGPR